MVSQLPTHSPRPPKKAYRKTRRPPATLRTKTGCLTCLQRKKKCDETVEVCRNCSRSGMQCTWRHCPSSVKSPARRVCNGKTSTSPESVDESTTAVPRTALVSSGVPATLYNAYSPVLLSEAVPLFQYYTNVYLPQITRPQTNSRFIRGAEEEIITMGFHTPFLMHALLATSAGHLAKRSEHYRSVAEFHYGQAVKGLRLNLQRKDTQTDMDAVLLAIIGLCIYSSESSDQRPPEEVTMHIVGAAEAILQCLSNNPSHYHQNHHSPAQTAMQRLILESFFFHASRRPLFVKMMPARLTAVSEAISVVHELFCASDELLDNPAWSTSPLLGPNPTLFIYVYQLSLLQSQTHLSVEDVNYCLHLEAELRDLESSTIDRTRSVSEDLGNDNDDDSHTLLGDQLYILACRLLLNRILDDGSMALSSHRLATQALRIIHLVPAGSDYHASYYFWPLSIIATSISQLAGLDLGVELCEEIHGMRAGNRSTPKLIYFLSTIWEYQKNTTTDDGNSECPI
ncbi:hypothetical protein AYL99_08184 [Fonsecaea erecta]|uniref:Zn(2)-C6 fungal-type domain-containing protein n=1 Tax=Fonsecaea erecta TaxID=1367422 RepID=A0A178ZDA2_9EURO|nr:hypothetical protein AYL99_08184 [Fonsecaea erecta]OAP57446.1 hypothetical protein AYL99_08184 [Fonsecaea erecta]